MFCPPAQTCPARNGREAQGVWEYRTTRLERPHRAKLSALPESFLKMLGKSTADRAAWSGSRSTALVIQDGTSRRYMSHVYLPAQIWRFKCNPLRAGTYSISPTTLLC